MQHGLLLRPSIRAEPGPVVPRGRPVTVLCRGPAGADLFRLEHRSAYTDQKITSQHGSPGTEARFPIRAEAPVKSLPCPQKWAPRQVPNVLDQKSREGNTNQSHSEISPHTQQED
ncbi:leukocyte-associated immunoglobulin-like receptor 1 isoform X2 [Rhinolophus ferrumequinum]|nr:leukocyte-associated immunoglobulin-like receptor 1 isoform X2 [Rhinolophus ferrumequinum]